MMGSVIVTTGFPLVLETKIETFEESEAASMNEIDVKLRIETTGSWPLINNACTIISADHQKENQKKKKKERKKILASDNNPVCDMRYLAQPRLYLPFTLSTRAAHSSNLSLYPSSQKECVWTSRKQSI